MSIQQPHRDPKRELLAPPWRKRPQAEITCQEYKVLAAKRRPSDSDALQMAQHTKDCRTCGHDRGINHLIADITGRE